MSLEISDSFTKIGSTYVADGQILSTEGANWKEISVFVPKGTKYFAIHQTTPSANTYLFGIDDDHYYNVTAVFTAAQGNVTESSSSNTASLSLSI